MGAAFSLTSNFFKLFKIVHLHCTTTLKSFSPATIIVMGMMFVHTGSINVKIYTQQNANWTREDTYFAARTFTNVKNTVANTRQSA